MKIALVIIALLVTGRTYAATSSLECASESGSVLKWNEQYGELTVTTVGGKVTVDQDGLVLGETKYIETMPGMFATPILFGDETPAQALAEIQAFDDGSKQIALDGEIFSCQ